MHDDFYTSHSKYNHILQLQQCNSIISQQWGINWNTGVGCDWWLQMGLFVRAA